MLTVGQNHYAFSPNPWFIAAFFSGQVVLQLAWIRKLFTLDPAGYQNINGGSTQTAEDVEAIQTATEYAPIYALGNLCIGKSRYHRSWLVRSSSGSGLARLLAARGIHGLASLGHYQHGRSARGSGSPPSHYARLLEAHGLDAPCRKDFRWDWCTRLAG